MVKLFIKVHETTKVSPISDIEDFITGSSIDIGANWSIWEKENL